MREETATLPDVRFSRAAIIGTGRYQNLPSLYPAVHNNVAQVCDVLQDRDTWGLPVEHFAVVEDGIDSESMLDAVNKMAKEATDTLLVYYSGHGLIDPRRGNLHLCLTGSSSDRIYTAVPYEHIRDIVLSSRAIRKIVVLDCCYSGRALGQMGSSGELFANEASAEGTYILAAVAENRQALAPPGRELSLFTGELLDVLNCGVPNLGEILTLDQVYTQVLTNMREKGLPLPQKRDRNTAGKLGIVRNRANRSSVPEETAPCGEESSQTLGDRTLRLDRDIDAHIEGFTGHEPTGASPRRKLGTVTAESLDREIDAHIRELG